MVVVLVSPCLVYHSSNSLVLEGSPISTSAELGMLIPFDASTPVVLTITSSPYITPYYALPKGPRTTGDWSSLIGIVTAIIGNILISFALNTQRLAHVRLAREYGEAQEADRNRNNANSGKRQPADYGSIQIKIAEERAKANHKPGPSAGDGEVHAAGGNDETSALIPSLCRQDSGGSDSTIHEADEKAQGPSKKKSYLRSPYWWAGIIMMTVGEAGNFLAYGFAPASIVSPLGVVALISNCLIAPIMLKEKFRKRDLLGVVIAVGGAVTVVLSAEGSNPKLGPDEIWELITHWEFETYLGITVGLIVVLMVLSNRYGDRTILVDLGLVGLFGGYTALSTKGVASLLSYRLWRVFAFPITYLLVAILIGTAIMQIKYVNRALQRFDSTQVIPVQFVMFTIFVILGSAILYRDFEKATPRHIAQFVGGCALTFLGVWCITSGRTRNDDQRRDSREADDEQGEIDLVDEEAQEGGEEAEETNESESENENATQKAASEEDEQESAQEATQNHPSTPKQKPRRKSTTHLPPTTPPARPHSQTGKHLYPPPSGTTRSATTTRPSTDRAASSTTSRSLPRPNRNTTTNPTTLSTSPSHFKPTTTTHHLRPPPSPYTRTASHSATTRRSLSQHMGMTLGPLTSPLSAGLSAVVADTLRRREYFPDSSPVVEEDEAGQGQGGRLRPRRSGADLGAGGGGRRGSLGGLEGMMGQSRTATSGNGNVDGNVNVNANTNTTTAAAGRGKARRRSSLAVE